MKTILLILAIFSLLLNQVNCQTVVPYHDFINMNIHDGIIVEPFLQKQLSFNYTVPPEGTANCFHYAIFH